MSGKPEELIPVNVWLAGRSYRIRIAPQDEARVRSAVKKADAQIAELRSHYAGRDDQDFVAMCLLMYATESGKEGGVDKDAVLRLTEKIERALGGE